MVEFAMTLFPFFGTNNKTSSKVAKKRNATVTAAFPSYFYIIFNLLFDANIYFPTKAKCPGISPVRTLHFNTPSFP